MVRPRAVAAVPGHFWVVGRGLPASVEGHSRERRVSTPEISIDREAIEEVLLRVLRSRYPGRAITIGWDEHHPVADLPAATTHVDGVEDAA